MLGYVPQAISADGDLTGYENLLIYAKLFHVRKEEREGRIRNALNYMNLDERTNDLVKHYSGGMMRRLEIAQSLVNRPRMLFLDEPTIGLDPRSRTQVREYIRRLKDESGATILITTHDTEEAEKLCERLVIMNAGVIAVSGTPDELKKSAGEDFITVTVAQREPPSTLPAEIGELASAETGTITIRAPDGRKAIPRVVEYLEKRGIVLESISLRRPTLDDVFMKYGGTGLESGSLQELRSERRSFVRHAGGCPELCSTRFKIP